MGEAMIASLLANEVCLPADICVSDVSSERLNYLKQTFGVNVTENSADAASGKDIIVIAVKPQNIEGVFSDLNGCLKPEQMIVSIAAGIRLSILSQSLHHNRIVRVMPNTPAQIGSGMSGWTATDEVSTQQRDWVKSILGTMGKEIYFEDEKYLDMVTAVSGSGPAYFFLMAEAMIEAAKAIGASQEKAEELVSQTMLGAANLIQQSDKTPGELRQNVTSRGGTTERALSVLNEGGFSELIRKAIEAAYQRSKEIGN